MRLLRWLPSLIVLAPWLFGTAPSTDVRIRDLAGPVSFRLLDWETLNLGARAGRLSSGLVEARPATATDDDLLRAYFFDRRSPAQVEPALERTVGQAYADAGLTRSQALPTPNLFPPVLVALTPPPKVLVISPRSELRVSQSVVLAGLASGTDEGLEASADSNNVSSLVAPIGGLATYPAMVLADDAPERLLASVAHEWLHQYLIFYPLGAGYWRSQETREINETTADMVGQEVGAQIATRLQVSAAAPNARASSRELDFRVFMRETRQRTEQLLGQGDIDAAESYMHAQRDELQRQGYNIRKLNQAYFALYGSYGDGFAASPANPIPDLLRRLRARSASLGDFLVRMRGVTSVSELRAAATS